MSAAAPGGFQGLQPLVDAVLKFGINEVRCEANSQRHVSCLRIWYCESGPLVGSCAVKAHNTNALCIQDPEALAGYRKALRVFIEKYLAAGNGMFINKTGIHSC